MWQKLQSVLAHMLKDCKNTELFRIRMRTKLKLFNISKGISLTDKTSLFKHALSSLETGNKRLLSVLCEFLICANE